jgi:integrase
MRDKDTGSIYRRKSDGLYVSQYKGHYKYSKDKATAKKKLAAMLKAPEQVKPSKITVATALDQYLETAKQRLKARSLIRYQVAADKHLKPALSKQRVDKLAALQVEQLYSDMLKAGSSPASVRLTHAVLSSAVKRCVRLQLVDTNICSSVELPRQQPKKIEVFTDCEVQRILRAAQDHALHVLYVLLLSTGLRTGEAFALELSAYAPAARTLSINKTMYNGSVSTPKSKNSDRVIVLPTQACKALDSHIEAVQPTRWLFTKNGHTISHHFPRDLWQPLLARADVPYRSPQTARHTVASKLLGKGIPAPAVAAYLGHDLATLLKSYAHAMPDSMQLVANALD